MNILNPAFKYVPARDMKPDYLREKFAKIREQQAKEQPVRLLTYKRKA